MLNGYFLSDDFGVVGLYHDILLGDLLKAFAADWSQGIWGAQLFELRPLVLLVYRLDGLIWGTTYAGYSLTNIAFHVSNSLLVFLIGARLFERSSRAAWLGAIFFALAPCHSEAVSWVAGRVDLVSTFFYLASCLAFIAYVQTGKYLPYRLALAAFGAALFSKESAVVLPLMLSAYVLIYGSTGAESLRSRLWVRKLASTAPFFLVLAVYFLVRKVIFGAFLGGRKIDLEVLRTYFDRQSFYLQSLVFPVEPVRSLSRGELAWLEPLALTVGIIAVWSLAETLRDNRDGNSARLIRPLIFLGPVWYVISMLPVLAVHYLSDRHLYIASAGVSLWGGFLLAGFEHSRGNLARRVLSGFRTASAVLWLVFFAVSLNARNAEWVRSGRLSRAMLEGIETLTANLPNDSTILIGEGPKISTWYLDWALPFALERPFSDVYARFRVLEPPGLYCCSNWWSAKRGIVEDVIRGRGPGPYLFRWDEPMEKFVLRKIESDEIEESLNERMAGGTLPAELPYEDALRILHDLGLPGADPPPDPYMSALVGRRIEEFTVRSHEGIRGSVAVRPAPRSAEAPLQVAGWAVSSNRSRIRAELSNKAARSGKSGLALSGSGGVWQEVAGLTPDRVYEITAWARAVPGSEGKAVLRLHDTRRSNHVRVGPRAVSDSRFERFEAKFRANKTSRVRIHLQYSGQPGTLYWDDVGLFSKEVNNGTFEGASLRPWRVYGPKLPPPLPERLEIAIVVNGEIVAVTSSGTVRRPDVARFFGRGKRKFLYSGWLVFLPGELLREGPNTLEAHVVSGTSKDELFTSRARWRYVVHKRGEVFTPSRIR